LFVIPGGNLRFFWGNIRSSRLPQSFFTPWDLFLPLTSQNLDFSAACSAAPEHAPFIHGLQRVLKNS
jgi:hypothetical protein